MTPDSAASSSAPAPAKSEAAPSASASSAASAASAKNAPAPPKTCEVPLTNPKLDCEKAWKNYQLWVKAKCATGKPDTREQFMKWCKSDQDPAVIGTYGCLERHSECDAHLACESACFAAAEELKTKK